MDDSILQRLRVNAYKKTDRNWPRAWVAALILSFRIYYPASFAEIARVAVEHGISPKTVQRGLRELEKIGIVKRNEYGEYTLDTEYKVLVKIMLAILGRIEKAIVNMNLNEIENYEKGLRNLPQILREQGILNWFTENMAKYVVEFTREARELVASRYLSARRVG